MNKRQKILIVDDAKFNRDILKEFFVSKLTQVGCRV